MEFASCKTTGDHLFWNWNTGLSTGSYRQFVKNTLKKVLENDATDWVTCFPLGLNQARSSKVLEMWAHEIWNNFFFLDLFNENFLRHKAEAEGPVTVILQWKFFLTSELDNDYINGFISASEAIFSCRMSATFISWCTKIKKSLGRGCKDNGSNLFSQGPEVSLFCL